MLIENCLLDTAVKFIFMIKIGHKNAKEKVFQYTFFILI